MELRKVGVYALAFFIAAQFICLFNIPFFLLFYAHEIPYNRALVTSFLASCSEPKNFDCKTFLAKEIDISMPPEKIMKECLNLQYCGLNTTDLKQFIQPPIIGTLMVKATDDKTYGYILTELQKIKQ